MRIAIFLSVAWTAFFLLHLFVYVTIQRVYGVEVPYQYLWVGVLAALYFVASALTRRFHNRVAQALYAVAAVWIGVIWLLFSATLLYGSFYLITGEDAPSLYGILLGAAVLASAYALWNGRRLVVKEHTIPLQHLTAPLRVAHLSDIHVGTVHREPFLERVVALTNSTKPDLILITGDLFDGSAPIDESILEPLNHLSAPAYFSTGNHEGYEGLDHVRTTLSHLKLTLLENAVAEHQGVRIIGVHDRQNLARSVTLESILASLPALERAQPTILMYHTPVEWEVARKYGAGLMLSGHTHNGQIFPFTILVRIFFRYVTGLYTKDGVNLHISPGTGTWGPPMRLGSRNQVTVFNLVPTEAAG